MNGAAGPSCPRNHSRICPIPAGKSRHRASNKTRRVGRPGSEACCCTGPLVPHLIMHAVAGIERTFNRVLEVFTGSGHYTLYRQVPPYRARRCAGTSFRRRIPREASQSHESFPDPATSGCFRIGRNFNGAGHLRRSCPRDENRGPPFGARAPVGLGPSMAAVGQFCMIAAWSLDWRSVGLVWAGWTLPFGSVGSGDLEPNLL